ncbi:hypothetical protein FNYG_10155 [Fusarium nygamai]|uniref:Transferase family protein n=1 Tax=Gibberella nygamai TaxID=42673 RepID=A0A2K0W398_GIBNY|nr:hypothetical protein FNYG_10155 [Fusarium nygamai]
MAKPHSHPEVITTPLLPKDQYRPLENLRSQLYFIIRQKLNEQLLKKSLDDLIRQHLPVLGARLKPTGRSKALEYHLPQPFPEKHLLFGWSSASVASSISEITILNAPIRIGGAITWGKPMPELEKLWIPANWPLERKHEDSDCPLLLVHLKHYTDSTIVSTSLPHCVADQMGYASVIEAWLGVVQGKLPTPFLQLDQNIFDTSSKFSDEILRTKGQYRLKSFLERARVILSHGVEVTWEQEEERRLLFLSQEAISRLRNVYNRTALAELDPDSPKLTDNDVITGILAKLRYLSLTKGTFVSLSGAINARGRHPALPAGQPFLHNALAYSNARFRISPDTTAAEIAYQNRLAMNEAVKLENIERCFAVHEGIFHGGYSPHIGEPGDTTYAVTNWTGTWRNIDFTVASPRHYDPDTSSMAMASTRMSQSSVVVLGVSMERSLTVLRCKCLRTNSR